MTNPNKPKLKPSKPFTMVRRTLWRSKRFGGLPDDGARYLYLYFLTCPHQTGTGCFVADDLYVVADLRKTGSAWDLDRYKATRAHVVESGLVMFDEGTSEILITGWWNDNGPSNDDWFKGIQKQLQTIESHQLREAAQTALTDCWDAYLAAKGVPAAATSNVSSMATDRLAHMRNRLGTAA